MIIYDRRKKKKPQEKVEKGRKTHTYSQFLKLQPTVVLN